MKKTSMALFGSLATVWIGGVGGGSLFSVAQKALQRSQMKPQPTSTIRTLQEASRNKDYEILPHQVNPPPKWTPVMDPFGKYLSNEQEDHPDDHIPLPPAPLDLSTGVPQIVSCDSCSQDDWRKIIHFLTLDTSDIPHLPSWHNEYQKRTNDSYKQFQAPDQYFVYDTILSKIKEAYQKWLEAWKEKIQSSFHPNQWLKVRDAELNRLKTQFPSIFQVAPLNPSFPPLHPGSTE